MKRTDYLQLRSLSVLQMFSNARLYCAGKEQAMSKINRMAKDVCRRLGQRRELCLLTFSFYELVNGRAQRLVLLVPRTWTQTWNSFSIFKFKSIHEKCFHWSSGNLVFCCSSHELWPNHAWYSCIEDNEHGSSEPCLLKNILIPFCRSQKHTDSFMCGSETYWSLL